MSLRDVVIFAAGAEAFHTIIHLAFAYTIKLPLHMTYLVLTPTMNTWAIVINAIITVGLLWWASRLSK